MVDQNNLNRIRYTILGTMIKRPDCVGEVMTKLRPKDFDSVATRGLFEAISKLHFGGAPIDAVTVQTEAGEDFDVAIEEALKYHTDDILYYCDILQEDSRLYDIQCRGMALATSEDLRTANKVIDDINALMVTRQKIELIAASDAATEFYKRLRNEEKPEYLRWGIKSLDEGLFVELGDFVVIGGYPSSGKTLLSLQFAVRMATKYRVGYFSLETNVRKLSDRLMAHMAKVPLSEIKRRMLTEDQWKAIGSAAAELSKLQIDFISAAGMTVRDIQALSLNKRYQIIFVDYLQLVTSRGKDRYEEVTNISKDLHTMGQLHGITVIALAQLSRPDKSKGKPQPPSMSSFRESGQIEQDADVAMLLWPADVNDNRSNRILKVSKNKEGERHRLELIFDGATQTLTPVKPSLMAELSRIKAEERVKQEPKLKQMGFSELNDDLDIPF